MLRRLLVAVAFLVLIVAGIGVAGLHFYRAAGPLTRATDVVVPRGGMAAVAEALADAGVVRSALALKIYAGATAWQGPVRAAELSFPPRASLEHVLFVLRHARPVQHLLTVPEGVTASRLGEIFAAAPGLIGPLALPDEGAFLPETYAYERGGAAEAVLHRGHGSMVEVVAAAWRGRPAELILRTPAELVVLASLVERETHLPAERPLVAAVFLNRLRLGMKLQSDPTVVYAASGGGSDLSRGLRRDELDQPSPYNTYLRDGLPPGPICNPGAASIAAAAHPAQTDALYFVADGSGGHVFARSLSEHVRNVAQYRLLGH